MTGNTHIPFVTSCAYPPRAGNAVRPLVDGVPTYRRIAEAVVAARHSVWLTAAFVAPDFQMPDGSGTLFDVFDRAVEQIRSLGAELVHDVHVNPNAGHREIWLRDPDGYLVVLAERYEWLERGADDLNSR